MRQEERLLRQYQRSERESWEQAASSGGGTAEAWEDEGYEAEREKVFSKVDQWLLVFVEHVCWCMCKLAFADVSDMGKGSGRRVSVMEQGR